MISRLQECIRKIVLHDFVFDMNVISQIWFLLALLMVHSWSKLFILSHTNCNGANTLSVEQTVYDKTNTRKQLEKNSLSLNWIHSSQNYYCMFDNKNSNKHAQCHNKLLCASLNISNKLKKMWKKQSLRRSKYFTQCDLNKQY